MDAGNIRGEKPRARLCETALAALCLCGSLWAGDGTSSSSGQGSLDSLIAEIRQTRDIRTAAALYAQARAIDPRSEDLYHAYMETALKCGFPRLAYYAAAELTQLDAQDGQAWSVQAYYNAVRQDYRQAISAGAQAAELLPANPSLLNNMGYLLGWYEGLPIPPRLNSNVTQTLAVQKPNWLKSPVFAKCYQETVTAAKAYNEHLAVCKEKAQETRRRLDTLTGLAKKLQAAVSSNASVIDACDSKIDSLQVSLDRTLNDPTMSEAARNAQARGIESQMNILRERRNRWNGYMTQATQRMQSLSQEIRVAATANTDAEKRLKEAEVPTFKPVWRPPDVEGVVTADAEPSGPTGVSAAPAVAAAAAPAQSSSASIETLLDMAKLLIRNGLEEKGKESLKAIITKHPSTAAAKEAQAVLDNPVAAYQERPARPAEPVVAQPAPTEQAKPRSHRAKTPQAPAKKADAEELLQAARLLVRNDQSQAAQSLLQTIMNDHAGTPAAREAKVLLAGLK
ncbi:MAG: hypothetical protein ABFD92_11605 [Planctomycetaceae bacterium]|nr:hypothetical protein [Planctomycetaceae bacterium]